MFRRHRYAREDEGSVLIAVVGIMVVLTVLAIGAFAMADDNLRQSVRDRERAQALSVAESGIEQVLWRLRRGQPPTSTVVVVVPPGTSTVTPTNNGMEWHLVSVGVVGRKGVSRTVSVDVLSLSMWDMFYADGPIAPGQSGHFNGNGRFYGSMYMRGNWPTTNGDAQFNQGPFFVKDGNTILGGNSHIGGDPNYPKPHLFCNGVVDMSNITATLHTNVPDLPMPEQPEGKLSTLRNLAGQESVGNWFGQPGGLQNDEERTSGDATGPPSPRSGAYKVVDNDPIAWNKSVTTFTLGQGQPSFGHRFDPTNGSYQDDFSWDATQGILTVQGTVFIDAQDLWLNDICWAGKGTIICTGNVHVRGKWQPYDATIDPNDPKWLKEPPTYPSVNCVGVSANGYIEEYSPDGFGPFFSGTSWSMDPAGNAKDEHFHGEIIAPMITFPAHATVYCTPHMAANLPPNMPAGDGQLVVVSGWHEGRH